MLSLVKRGNVFFINCTKSSSVTMFCGVKSGPSFALFSSMLAILIIWLGTFRRDDGPTPTKIELPLTCFFNSC